MRDGISEPQSYPADQEDRVDLVEEEKTTTTTTSKEILEDHLISLTTTTDEGNFSECGDPTSSEDKSSDGSNRFVI